MTEQKSRWRYLTYSELEQFKMDCPICGITVNLIQFSEHLRENVERINNIILKIQSQKSPYKQIDLNKLHIFY